jgi:phenylacetate-coenzyme A ligase PaaK-like adenylate-forming protein
MKPFLDEWIAGMTGEPFCRERLERYQLERLRKTVELVRAESPFYRERLASLPDGFPSSLDEFSHLPPTLPGDLAAAPEQFHAAPQDKIARIVTLRTSGSTGEGKRLFFTGDDLDETVDIFRIGMATFVRPGGRALVLLPGERPGSIGDLLVRALAPERECILCPASDERRTLERIAESKAESLVGLPAQVLSLARCPDSPLGRTLSQVLLCADYAAPSLVSAVENAWECVARRHYGLTETVYGGALECSERDGLHVMEGNYLFEILNPETLTPTLPGEFGEIVVTSLRTEGTPLLRYRTGDRGRFLSGTCRCGSILRRIETTGRLRNGITLHNGVFVPLHELDEALFSIPWLADYSASADDEHVLVSLHAPSREATTPEPAPQELAALAAALENLSADAKAALRNRQFRFLFLPHAHDGVSSRKRIAG